jgi:phosphoglycolate phosphatase
MGILALTKNAVHRERVRAESSIERVRAETSIERVRADASAAKARVALFDFDGTISTIRSGWIDVMTPLMVGILVDLKTGESEADLDNLIREMVWRTTGKETIYQMMDFASEVTKRGGTPLEPLQYKKMYLDLLWQRIVGRIEDLKQERVAPEQYMVPGARAVLDALRERGLKMYLASGTDEIYMREEARLLGVSHYFDGGVFGAQDDYSFSKKILIQRILSSTDVRGGEIVGFGDGYVEIEETKLVGGVTVGVATKEPECAEVDDWKRRRLIGVGADFVVPNFLEHGELMETLFTA